MLAVVMFIMALAFTATKSFAQQRTPWVTPKVSQEVKNPLAGDKSVLADAKVLYVNNCAPCHGTKGRGDGPAAAALTPKPADHSSVAVQDETDGSLFWKLSEGRNPMPSYKKILTDKQRWELVNYIRTLARNPIAK
ncbi:MAG: cytochrome c [Bacteroidetes bacterium]|nr:cytochrome c [Bacteroidota bacterium]